MVRLLPTAAESLAAQQVGRDVGWTGRSAHVFETSGHDPNAAIAHRPALRRRSSNRSSLGFEDEYQALYCCLRAIYDRCSRWGLAMWLKIIAFVYAFCYSAAVLDPSFYGTPFRAVGFLLAIGGLIGLFVVAFKKRFLSQRFWRCFAVVYVSYALIGLVLGGPTVIAAHGLWVSWAPS